MRNGARPRVSPLRVLALALACAVAMSCGARTGLRVWEAGPDADAAMEDVFIRFEACVPGRFNMVRRSAELLFVLDRSGSMSLPLEDGGTRRRWDALGDALATTLPRYDMFVDLGVLIFPRVPADSALGNIQYCDLSPGGGVDVAVAPNNALGVLSEFRAHFPQGGTPTAAAIRRGTGYLASRMTRGRARYLVLATDGAPNCNDMADVTTCVCMNPTGCPGGRTGSQSCLDDRGTIDAINAARMQGIFTYVVGLDGDIPVMFRRVLNDMADAGGRPNPTEPRYISIQRPNALTEAFERIQRTIVQCAFVTPSRPDDPDQIQVFIGGRSVPRDPTHQQGWDWTDRDYGELSLYGAPCDVAIATNATLEAQVGCLDH